MLAMFGLIGALALLVFLAMRGMSILVAAPICAILLAITSGIALIPTRADPEQVYFVTTYMSGFVSFFAAWFPMFLLGAIFGKMMEDSGAAHSIAHYVVEKLGVRYAVMAIVSACAVLTYGGVSVFIVAFSVYPMALGLFRAADLPRRFLPGVIAFGSVTFTMTSAGSVEIQNWIPTQYLGTTPLAGWPVSLVVALVMAGTGYIWLGRMIAKAVARGERFVSRGEDPDEREAEQLPHPILSLLPLVSVLGMSIWLYPIFDKWALLLALGTGIAVVSVLNWSRFTDYGNAAALGATGAVIAIVNTCAVVGFGSVAKVSPAFQTALEAVTQIPGHPLIAAAIAVTVICGLTGSASGGQAIALPLLAPHYVGDGAPHPVDPEALHRVVAIASGGLDSLPHNGYVVTTIRAICGETHKDAYGPVGALTVIVPAFGAVLAVLLFILF
ncbi:MAG: citrate transporter [Robiginitomaculum sp.]|nr:MAG: citrate transporter [Robiginitomaculum sp.]